MKKLLLASAAALLLSIAAPAFAADWPVRPALPPQPVLVPVFTWSSCYAGINLGGGWAHKDITDPVQLVQDQLNLFGGLGLPPTSPVTTTRVSGSGYVFGGQFGCDYQPVGSNWVIGFEGAASGGNIKGQTIVALPLGDPGDQALVFARLDFIPSGTVRVGYALDRLLFYVKAGAAAASDKYAVSGTFQAITNPTVFNFQGLDLRYGWTAGGGVEWAFCEDWSVKVEYDYYDFGRKSVLMSDSNLALSAPVDIKQTAQTVKLGLNFHMWSSRW